MTGNGKHTTKQKMLMRGAWFMIVFPRGLYDGNFMGLNGDFQLTMIDLLGFN